MEVTFWFWTWTVSSSSISRAVILGVIAGLMYFYMVAAWGGYVFVINLIGLHAFALFLLRKVPFDHLYASYTTFYFVGTCLAVQVPVVGWMPLKSLEQLGPFGVFAGFQVLQLMRILESRYGGSKWKIRGIVLFSGAVVSLPVVYWLYTKGYFGPISSRVRGLFVEHTKTGNPLVDSVAEHQAASPQAYFQYLNIICYLAPVGFLIVALIACSPASSFLLVYGVTAYFFSLKMVRLILLAAPIASICGGIALGYFWAWSIGCIFGSDRPSLDTLLLAQEGDHTNSNSSHAINQRQTNTKCNETKKGESASKRGKKGSSNSVSQNDPIWIRGIRVAVGLYAVYHAMPLAKQFKEMCHQVAKQISHPTIITKGTNRQTGEVVVVDDYREAYFWLKEKTPEDARIMAWWDYGYQITGIGNRTTIADGNTWNHEHIALLGRILTGPEKDAHRIARHL